MRDKIDPSQNPQNINLKQPVEYLGLSVKILSDLGGKMIYDIEKLMRHTESEIAQIVGYGPLGIDEVIHMLRIDNKLSLAPSET